MYRLIRTALTVVLLVVMCAVIEGTLMGVYMLVKWVLM